MLNFPFSAALMAGGESRRMGRDKAGLMVQGQPLWKRQMDVLGQLRPTQLFICGRPDGPYMQEQGIDVITDEVPSLGPLGGLMTALHHSSTELLVLLAVDLPAMRADFLEKVLHRAQAASRSVIPLTDHGFEPLAAVYQINCLTHVEEQLRQGHRSMRSLITSLIDLGLAETFSVDAEEFSLFLNVNTPGDLEAL